jgi:hypothetical protein
VRGIKGVEQNLKVYIPQEQKLMQKYVRKR